MFTVERLVRLCPHAFPSIVVDVAPVLASTAALFDVVTPLRAAHLVAQLAHESAGFTRLVENLNYSEERIAVVWPRLAGRARELAHRPEALGNAAYAGKLGNGDEASGDGFRFRGRGLIQITGRGNYSFFGAAAGVDIVSHPDQAAEAPASVLVALAFWRSRKCNLSADRDDVEGVTRAINGPGLAGLAERQTLTERAKFIFNATTDLIA